MSSSFSISLVFQGKTTSLPHVTTSTTPDELYLSVLEALQLSDETRLKLLYKGKRIDPTSSSSSSNQQHVVFPSVPTKTPKIMVMATSTVIVQELATKRSDPLLRGFEQEEQKQQQQKQQSLHQHWGQGMIQDKNFKFCRFEACTWQEFGHRPTERTPHSFEALQLLEKLATDPGIVAVVKERELVVGTLGELDPIDDRLMLKKQQEQQGSCLLGYNTNGGARIDIKLRSEDLQTFRPYPELVSTLIHELSHNWVGDHNLLFWTNYAQMYAEYLFEHARLRSTIVRGTTTAELAGLDKTQLDHVYEYILHHMVPEMSQHGLHPNMIAEAIRIRCDELLQRNSQGQRLGGGGSETSPMDDAASVRERVLAAAEQRSREQQQEKKQG
jgi:WLM domain